MLRTLVTAVVGGFATACVAIDPNANLCAVGAADCSCTLGGVCDPGLQCIDDRCVERGADSTGVDTTTSAESTATDGSTGPTTSTDETASDSTGIPPLEPNVVFVTSASYSAGALGGLDGADEICANAAAAGGLTGTFRAWLSTPGSDARERLADARGWVRPDGLAFARDVPQILANTMYFPAAVDEHGVEVPPLDAVWTGTIEDGTAHDVDGSGMCGGWTIDDAQMSAWFGVAGGGPFWWTTFASRPCNQPAHVRCFGVDAQSDLGFMPTPGRLVFASEGALPADAGRAAVDAMCQAEADAAGLAGTFLAVMAQNGEAPSARFDAGGPPWVRADGVPIFAPGAVFGDVLRAPVAFDIDGMPSALALAWSGTFSPSVAGVDMDTCGNWTNTTGFSLMSNVLVTNWHGWVLDNVTPECSLPYGAICMQQ